MNKLAETDMAGAEHAPFPSRAIALVARLANAYDS